jgi:transcriptional regulator with XRE-family HTH domain
VSALAFRIRRGVVSIGRSLGGLKCCAHRTTVDLESCAGQACERPLIGRYAKKRGSARKAPRGRVHPVRHSTRHHVAVEVASSLGSALRARRVVLGQSLRSVASTAEVSASFISQVENDKARPRIETLHRIAAALGTTAQALLADASAPSAAVRGDGAVVSRAAQARVISQSDDPADGLVRSLVGGASVFHALEITGAPPEFGEPYKHPGDELLYVVSGRVEVRFGDELFQLGPGDSLSYSGGVQHSTRRLSGDVRLVIVTTAGS